MIFSIFFPIFSSTYSLQTHLRKLTSSDPELAEGCTTVILNQDDLLYIFPNFFLNQLTSDSLEKINLLRPRIGRRMHHWEFTCNPKMITIELRRIFRSISTTSTVSWSVHDQHFQIFKRGLRECKALPSIMVNQDHKGG